MPVRTTPEQAAQKWQQRLSQASQQITDGVNRVSRAPGQAAAEKYNKWQAAIAESGEKWRRNVARVSLEDWKSSMINIGIPRVSQGAQAKVGKVQAFAADFFPHLERGVAMVAGMPDTSFEDRVNRAVAMMRHNRDFKRSA